MIVSVRNSILWIFLDYVWMIMLIKLGFIVVNLIEKWFYFKVLGSCEMLNYGSVLVLYMYFILFLFFIF